MSKSKMRKLLSMILVVVMTMTLFAVAGCGSDETTAKPDGGTTTAAGETDGGNNNGGDEEVTLSFYSWWADAEQDMGKALIADFEDQNPGIKIEPTFIDVDDYLSKLNALVAADTMPDVYYMNEYLVSDWGNAGVSADLAPLFDTVGINADETWVESALYKSDDKLYGINYGSTTIVMYYNKQMLADAGIEAPSTDATKPWTWDQYAEAAVKLTKDVNGNTPLDPGFDINSTTVFGTTMTNSWIYWLPVLYASGTSIANDDGTELLITEKTATDALQAIADLHHQHKAAPSVGVSDSVFSDTSAMLMNGQLGMFIGGTFLLGNFTKESYDVGITQLPTQNGADPSNMVWSAAFGMSAKSEHPEEAAKFLAFMADYDNSVKVSKEKGLALGSLPSTFNTLDESSSAYTDWTSVYDASMAEVTSGILAGASRAGENTTLQNFSVLMDELLVPAIDEIWLGEKTAEQAMNDISDQLKSNLKGTW